MVSVPRWLALVPVPLALLMLRQRFMAGSTWQSMATHLRVAGRAKREGQGPSVPFEDKLPVNSTFLWVPSPKGSTTFLLGTKPLVLGKPIPTHSILKPKTASLKSSLGAGSLIWNENILKWKNEVILVIVLGPKSHLFSGPFPCWGLARGSFSPIGEVLLWGNCGEGTG